MIIIERERKIFIVKKNIFRYHRFFGQVITNKLLQAKVIQIITYIFGIIHRQRYVIHYLVKNKKPKSQKCDHLYFCYLLGHTSRILSLIMSPKGNPIVSLSADETIRFWNCFPMDIQRKKKIEMTRTQSHPTQLNFNCR